MSDLRSRFVARFGGDLAEQIEAAVEHHCKAIPGQIERGSDGFR